MNKKDLFDSLVCALTHNIEVCDKCKKCGMSGSKARLNLIKELTIEFKENLPWREDESKRMG